MAATENFEFYKEDKGVEKIVKEKKTETETNEQLTEEITNVISSKSEYKQIVVWFNVVRDKWDCTFRTCIIPLGDTIDSESVNHPDTPACLSFEYRDQGYWVMRVEKAIDEEWHKIIKAIRKLMREAFETGKKQEPRCETV